MKSSNTIKSPKRFRKSFFFACYEEFRQESFWEEMVIRLADRDLAQRIGFDVWNQLTEEQRRSQTVELENATGRSSSAMASIIYA